MTVIVIRRRNKRARTWRTKSKIKDLRRGSIVLSVGKLRRGISKQQSVVHRIAVPRQ